MTAFPGVTVPEQILACAARYPRLPAVVCGGRVTTYGDLAAAVMDTAGALSALGLPAETHVALRMPRSEDLVITLIGTLAAGLAYVPVDPGLPQPRIDAIMASARPGAVITGTRPRAPGRTAQWAAEIPPTWPQQLAYTIYTSGSTGVPKGVGVTHEALAHFLTSVDPILDVSGQRRVLGSSAVAFDVSVLEVLWPLSRGHCVYLATDEEAASPRALLRLIADCRIDLVQATPSRWAILLAMEQLPPGVTALSGGEALSAALAEQMTRSAQSVVNLYGPTETCVYSMGGQIAPAGVNPVLGKTLGATTVSIRDSRGRECPDGQEGELWIGGPGLARGYLNDPRRTASSFVPGDQDPPGSRLYQTGDMVRRTQLGVAFIGRIDHQAKIRGFRVESGDIENNARCHQDVIDATVIFDAGVILLFYTSRTGARITDIRGFLAARLPDYMVPDESHHVLELPLTLAGKVDRARLRESGRLDSPPVASAIAVQELMTAILGAPVGAEQDFIAAGADSLMAARLAARLSRRHKLELSAGQVMKLGTARAIADHFAGIGGAGPGAAGTG